MKKQLLMILCAILFLSFAATASAVQIGDVNLNNEITTADARLALRQSVGLESFDGDAFSAADTNADGLVTTSDARMILRVSVGLQRFEGDFSVDFIDVGQAKSILVQCGNESMLIDAGNVADGDAVSNFLKAKGLNSLTYAVCTHAHEDHVGGFADVLDGFTVTKTVFAPEATADTACYRNFLSECEEQGKTPVVPALGSTFSLGESTVQVYGPVLTDAEDLNDTSIVLKITYRDTAFLFTGDAETPSEHAMIDNGYDLSADVLDVGHHGSSSSTSYVFLREVMPEFAVISCGADNEYGHPNEDVLSRLHDADVNTYRTDLQGNIAVISNGKALAFYTDKNEPVTPPADDPITPPEEKPTDPPTETPTAPPANEPDIGTGEYVGNINTKKFHLPTCSSLPKEENRIYFATRDTAIANEYTPCNRCKP